MDKIQHTRGCSGKVEHVALELSVEPVSFLGIRHKVTWREHCKTCDASLIYYRRNVEVARLTREIRSDATVWLGTYLNRLGQDAPDQLPGIGPKTA